MPRLEEQHEKDLLNQVNELAGLILQQQIQHLIDSDEVKGSMIDGICQLAF